MATLVNLTINGYDIIGAGFDPSRASAYLTPNTPHGVVVVDSTAIRLGGKRIKFDQSGNVTYTGLVATNSADNPTSFAYRVTIVYTPIGARKQEEWTSSDFTLTASANLAALSEPFDGLVITPTWRQEIINQIEQLAGIEDTDDAVAYQMEFGTESATYLSGNYAKVFTPKAFGAVEDGVVDDTAALQAALTATRAAKGVLQLKSGATYLVAATLNPAGVTIDGRGAILKQKAGVTGFPFFTSTTGPVRITGLELDGNRSNTTVPGSVSTNGSGIYMFRASGGDLGQIEDVTIHDVHGPGIRIGGTRNPDPQDNNRTPGMLANVRIWNARTGIQLDAARDVKIVGGSIKDVDLVGIQDDYGCDNSVHAMSVDGTGTAHGIISQYSWGWNVSSCRVRRVGIALTTGSGFSATGIQIGGGDPTYNVAAGFTIANNVVKDAWNYGISIDPTLTGSPGVVQTAHGTISGNICTNNGTRAFASDPVTNGGSGIYLHQAAQVAVTGNVCRSNQRAGIIDDGLDNIITGNDLISNGSYGVEIRCASGETKGRSTIGPNNYVGNPTDVFTSQYAISGDVTLPGSRKRVKTADQTVTNTTTTALDTELVFGNVVPGYYEITGMIVVDSSAVADFRAAWQVPAGTDLTWTLDAFNTSASSTVSPVYREPVVATAASGLAGTTTSGNTASGTLLANMPAGVMRITTTGTVTFRFAQATAEATNTTVKARSYLCLTRIA